VWALHRLYGQKAFSVRLDGETGAGWKASEYTGIFSIIR
jgi:hypothetical protein